MLQHKLKNALSTLSRNTDPVETPAGPVLVAMVEQPVLVTPGTMQQNLLNPHNQIVQTEQEDGLQQKQEQQLTNIDLHAVNQGIDLLNKYYPGLGQVTFQPVQQLQILSWSRTSNLPASTATATNQPTYSKTMGKCTSRLFTRSVF